MSKSKKQKQLKLTKKKKIVMIVAACLVVALVAGIIIWFNRPKSNGIYDWYGGKMKADYILKLTVDVGDGETEYMVPFSEYRAQYLYYAARVTDYIVYNGDTSVTTEGGIVISKTDEGVITKFAAEADKNTAVKEVAEDKIIEYYSRLALADKLGVGLTEEDKAGFDTQYEKYVSDYAKTLSDGEIKGDRHEYAVKRYEETLNKLGMSKEYLRYLYYSNILYSRIKSTLGYDLESMTNESYYAFRELYVSFTIGDSEQEKTALSGIEKAYERLNAGEDIDTLIAEYNDNYKDTIYFDFYGSIVGSTSKDEIGSTISEIVKSLGYGEHSGIVSGEEDDTHGYYAVILREKITKDFICSDDTNAEIMYMYPYFGAETYSTAYSEYLFYMDVYDQNIRREPVDKRVYNRIALNTVF